MKKKKIMHLAALFCFLIAAAVILWKSCQGGSDQSETLAEETETVPAGETATASDAEEEVIFSDKLCGLLEEGIAVCYDGSEIVFPCDCADILGDTGSWEVHADGLYDSAVSFGTEGLSYDVLLYFPLDMIGDLETLESAGCSGIGISLISLEESIGEVAPEFRIAGISWQDTETEIADVFGEAGYRNEMTDEDGALVYTYLLYQTEYDGKLYTLEFTLKDGTGVVAMSFYYIETGEDAVLEFGKSSTAAGISVSKMTDKTDTDDEMEAVDVIETDAEEPEGEKSDDATKNDNGSASDDESEPRTSECEDTEVTGTRETSTVSVADGGTDASNVTGHSETTAKKSGETTTTKKSETTATTKKSEETTTKTSETTATTKQPEETTTKASASTNTFATEEEKLAIIQGINNYRAEKGYTEMPVVLNTFLTEQAQEWAEYLAANNICESSMDKNAMSILSGTYYWNEEIYGEVSLLGRELSAWISRGESVGKSGMYDCPFIGVGVALNSSGKTVLVVQGIRQIAVYDSDGYLAFNEAGGQLVYDWAAEDSSGNIDYTSESSDYVKLVYKIYSTGHFADFIPDLYYTLTYGDSYYRYVPEWLKGSNAWVH